MASRRSALSAPAGRNQGWLRARVISRAAKIVVPESVADPLGYYLNNTVKTRALLESAVRGGVRRVIFSSTAAVYGEPPVSPVPEEIELNPINPYGRSKLMSEWMLADAAKAHGLGYVVLRYFNVAGADPRGRSGQSSPNATHLIKVAGQAALGQRDGLEVFGTDYPTPDGTCVRDYIHVTDLARAHLTMRDDGLHLRFELLPDVRMLREGGHGAGELGEDDEAGDHDVVKLEDELTRLFGARTTLGDIARLAGEAITVFASGFLAGGQPGFQAWVAETDGDTYPLEELVRTNELDDKLGDLQLSPNPAVTDLLVRFNLNESEQLRYGIRELTGRLLQEGDGARQRGAGQATHGAGGQVEVGREHGHADGAGPDGGDRHQHAEYGAGDDGEGGGAARVLTPLRVAEGEVLDLLAEDDRHRGEQQRHAQGDLDEPRRAADAAGRQLAEDEQGQRRGRDAAEGEPAGDGPVDGALHPVGQGSAGLGDGGVEQVGAQVEFAHRSNRGLRIGNAGTGVAKRACCSPGVRMARTATAGRRLPIRLPGAQDDGCVARDDVDGRLYELHRDGVRRVGPGVSHPLVIAGGPALILSSEGVEGQAVVEFAAKAMKVRKQVQVAQHGSRRAR